MKAPPPTSSSSSSSQKQKALSIHIATDHTGPSNMPLVYGSTADRIGSIRGTVRFSTNYPCKGKDIVIMYEAKAEAQWSALENKKVVRHQTEEILGYHIWHFPLEHTKSGGSTVAVGVYEKEFEVPLIHPSVSLRGRPVVNSINNSNTPSSSSPSLSLPPLSPSPAPSVSAGSASAVAPKINSAYHHLPHTTTTTAAMVGAKPVGPVGSTPTTTPITAAATSAGLLPSSSYSPQARIKYTIRAILQRPFPSITHVEASQEVWVLNSSLPPQYPLMSSLSPSTSVSRRSHSNASSKKRRRSAANKTGQTASSDPTSTPADKAPSAVAAAIDNKTSISPDSQEVALKSQSSPSLPMPLQVLKSALDMLPTIDLSRPKQLFSISKTGSAYTSESASGSRAGTGVGAVTGDSVSSSQPSKSAITASTVTSSGSATTKDTDATTEAGSSLSTSSVQSPRSNGTSDNYTEDNNDNVADYTGVWEAFDIPYSLSLPSEMVYLGQVVPLTIRFGPHRAYCSSNSNNTKQNTNGSHQDAADEKDLPTAASSHRFIVKKGVLRLVEHTLLREVTTAQVPHPKGSHGSKKHASKALTLTTTNAHHGPSQATLEEIFEDGSSSKDTSHRRAFSEQQPQSNSSSGNDGKAKPRIMVFGKRQDQNAIYQEQGYHGSHSHLPLPSGGGDSEVSQQQQRNTRTQHQHQLSLPGGGDAHTHQQHQGDLRRSFFKPNRHSMDVSVGRPVSMVNPYGPTTGNNSSSSSPRIVSSIEAKFKTEVMLLSLTPFLQRQEQWYQRQLIKTATAAGLTGNSQDGSDVDQDQQNESGDEDDEERESGGRGDMYVKEEHVEEDIEDGVWQTTIWVPIPGPSAMATFTETKNIVKTHTLQLILLCGLSEGVTKESSVPAVVVSQGEGDADSGSVSAVSLSNVNKEFRIEMDLHVTGPRAPVEMSVRQL